ncbi:MAG: sugar transferase [bacterium]|nr:sugar transferase [bacterium]
MIKFFSIFLDLVLVSMSEFLAFFLRFGYPLPGKELHHLTSSWFIILLVRLWSLYSVNAYSDKLKSFFQISNAIGKATLLSSVIITAITFFTRSLAYPRSVIILSLVCTLLFLSIKYYFFWKYYIIRKSKKNIVIIGASQAGRGVIKGVFALKHWNIIGFVDERVKTGRRIIRGLKVLGKVRELKKIVSRHHVNLAVVAMPNESIENKLRVLAECERIGLDYVIIPSFYEIVTGRAKLDEMDDMAIIEPTAPSISPVNKILKRGFDLVVSFLLLVLFFPFFLMIGILIKLSSKGPVVYQQKRSGRNGQPFYVYKFRTMVENADKIGPLLTDKEDNRITWIGRFLRRFSLDEILQFYNVLKGEMSVVGPRPEVVEIVKEYKEWQKKVLSVKPGLTGLAQISGRQELDIDTKLKLDLYYINNYSVLLDLEIALKTVFVVLSGKGAY